MRLSAPAPLVHVLHGYNPMDANVLWANASLVKDAEYLYHPPQLKRKAQAIGPSSCSGCGNLVLLTFDPEGQGSNTSQELLREPWQVLGQRRYMVGSCA